MATRTTRQLSSDLLAVLWNLTLMGAGSLICAVALNGILIPQKFVSGGYSGLALILHYLLPDLSVSLLYLLLNLPLYALGWLYVGRRFFLYSVAGLVVYSAAIEWVRVTLPMENPILAALLAGIITGIGSGIILRSLGSAGGLDILSVILMKRFSVRIGTSILVFNAVLLAFVALRFSIEVTLYALIFTYVSSKLTNIVLTGLSQRKAVLIISARWEPISKAIVERLQRSVTRVDGTGVYSGTLQHILYTVVTFQDLARVKEIIRSIDPDAFVVVFETLEVMDKRIGNQPHW